MRPNPLIGVRVIDLTTFLSGPFCTQILGDLGAEVIKVEPFAGDSSRAIPPHFVGEDSAYFLSTNKNKKSIALNLKSAEGQQVLAGLIDKADIVVENFRPGVCAKLGLDPTERQAANQKLIWLSISGFGQTGEKRLDPAYDMIVQALSGVMSLNGEAGRPAARLGMPAGDIVAGMYGAIAAIAALAEVRTSGKGRLIDIAMLDAMLPMLSYQAQYHLTAGITPGKQGAGHDSIVTYRSFAAKDGRELVVTANTHRMWLGLCDVLGLPDLPKQPEFVDADARLKNKERLWPQLEEAFLKEDAATWAERLREHSVPVALVKNIPEALAEARTYGRDMIVTATNDAGEAIDLLGSPIKYSDSEQLIGHPPRLSENAKDTLSTLLGMSDEHITALAKQGVVLLPKAAPQKETTQ